MYDANAGYNYRNLAELSDQLRLELLVNLTHSHISDNRAQIVSSNARAKARRLIVEMYQVTEHWSTEEQSIPEGGRQGQAMHRGAYAKST